VSRDERAARERPACLQVRHALEGHAQHSPAGHRLYRIRAEIHRQLVQVGGIADHRRIAGLDPALETNPRRQRRRQQFERLFDDD
jgi:hypothetical protein